MKQVQPLWRVLARTITHLLSPAGVAAVVFIAVPLLQGEGTRAGLVALGIYVVFPVALVGWVKAAWAISDVYDPGPRIRSRILGLGNAIYLVGFFTLTLIKAGPVLRWSSASFLVGASLVWLISRAWKISIHAVGVGGGVVILMVVGGPTLWPVIVAPLVVGWARLRLGAHTIPQLLAGSALGAGVSGALLPLF